MPTAEEYAALLEALAQATKGREQLAGELRVVRTERDLLKEQLNKFKRQLFAAKSEAGATHQKDLFFNEAEVLGAQAECAVEDGGDDGKNTVDVPAHKRAVKRGRKPLDPNLPRHVVRHELPESERVCPHDGAVLQEIGVVASEQMDIIPQQLRVIVHERVKYACPCCDGGLRLAAKPAQVDTQRAVHRVAVGLGDHVQIHGWPAAVPSGGVAGALRWFSLSRNTLAASVVRVGQAVQPVINLLRDLALDAPLIYGDETEIQVLKEAGRTAQAKSYMWVQMTKRSGPDGTGPPIHLFAYSPSRSTEAAERLYVGVRAGAVLMSDGYEVYSKIARAHRLVHLGCWAHARRYFHDAVQALPKNSRGPQQVAVRFIDLIAKLYQVESLAKEAGLDHEGLKLRRQTHSKLVLKDIEELLLVNLHAVLPGSLLGKALHYMSSQWTKLATYVEDGRYPIDNNACENSIRPFVVGRRNWLFADTVAGANASANLYSLLETCKANGIDGYAYLRALLVALPLAQTADDFDALLPWNIALPVA